MTEDSETIQYWIDIISETDGKLTKWEENFFDNVADTFALYHNISDKQEEILKQIYEKVS